MTTDCCTSSTYYPFRTPTKMPSSHSVDSALSLAQDSSKVLGLTVGNHSLASPGQFIPRGDAQSAPELSFKVPSSGTYIVISVDLDGPYQSFAVLSPILHWIQTDYKPTASEDGPAGLKTTAPFVANYIGPAPPPGSGPHRYLFSLYEQPEGFDAARYAPRDGKEAGIWGRMRFDLDAWEKETGLGPAIASNYFLSN